MSSTGFEIGRLDLSDKAQLNDAAAVAMRAFEFDPFFVFLSPRPLLRARGLGLFWRSEIAALGDSGEVYGARRADGRLVGVGAWVKPGGFPLPVANQLRQAAGALWALWPRPRSLVDGSKYLLAIEKVHMKDPHWYLNLLVVDPSAQRSGAGGALQAAVLERCDAEGFPAYLETQNPDNLSYYRRFGYEVVDELHPVPNGPPLWTMCRPAKA